MCQTPSATRIGCAATVSGTSIGPGLRKSTVIVRAPAKRPALQATEDLAEEAGNHAAVSDAGALWADVSRTWAWMPSRTRVSSAIPKRRPVPAR
jgi:hypothetical protein